MSAVRAAWYIVAHFPRVQTQRLLAHHVFAAGGGGHRQGNVREIRRRNDHGIDVRIVANLLVIGRDVVDGPVAFALLQQAGIGIARSHQCGAWVEANPRHMVIVTDGTGTDDGDANGLLMNGRHEFAIPVARW